MFSVTAEELASAAGGKVATPVAITANLMLLDQHTTAALVTVSEPGTSPA